MPAAKKPKPPVKPKAPATKKPAPKKTAKTKEYEKYLAKIMK